ncbi:MAG: hypothetical protein C5B51_05890 [Terriglobia bacterium]|nr:MAG: hypothetical protein C5B51_05890 [Terriglobia bacterium]
MTDLAPAFWDRLRDLPLTHASLIGWITSGYLAVGIVAFAAWRITGDIAWVVEFFQLPAALVIVWLGLMEVWLSIYAMSRFSPGDLLRPGWMLIAGSAGFQLLGSLYSQVFGVPSRLNPLRLEGDAVTLARSIGLLMGGPFRFALLAAGLSFALRAYRRAGLPARLAPIDWVILAGFGAYLARNVMDVVSAMRAGKSPDIWEVFGWPTDLLLWLLLAEALLLLRCTQQMAAGHIARCWKAYAAGVFLTALGDVGMWAANYGYLPWPWNSLTWYLWIPAAAAFARAPAFQLEVIREAATGRQGYGA